MASRNKKGKVHGIFKAAFQISFFHKPTMTDGDVYYYIVLEDLIFLKMRLLFDIVLVIDEVTPLSMAYLEPQYDKLFNLLRDQTSVAVLVSLIGNTTAFRQVCNNYGTPIVEKEEFLECSQIFYSKFKNYCRNDAGRYGFYLVALKEEMFSVMDSSHKEPIQEEEVVETPVKEKQIEPTKEIESPAEPMPAESMLESIPLSIAKFITYLKNAVGRTIKEIERDDMGGYTLTVDDTTQLYLFNGHTTPSEYIRVFSKWNASQKMAVLDMLTAYANDYCPNLHVVVEVNDVLYNMIHDDDVRWKEVGPWKTNSRLAVFRKK